MVCLELTLAAVGLSLTRKLSQRFINRIAGNEGRVETLRESFHNNSEDRAALVKANYELDKGGKHRIESAFKALKSSKSTLFCKKARQVHFWPRR